MLQEIDHDDEIEGCVRIGEGGAFQEIHGIADERADRSDRRRVEIRGAPRTALLAKEEAHDAVVRAEVEAPLSGGISGRFLERRLDSEIARIGAFVLAGMLVLGVARTIVWSRRFRFRLTDTTVETRAQVLTTATRVVPLGRVQHVDVRAGPVQRMLGIAVVSAHTAAGESTIVIPGLAAGAAEDVREHLLKERRREAV